MTSHNPIDVEKVLADQLATASPDLVRVEVAHSSGAICSALPVAIFSSVVL
jgi:hypothetical protein